jgi:hypothetical protein
MSAAVGVLGAVVLIAGAVVLLALLRGMHNAAVPTRLVERALERLPAELRERYAEEWRADLAALSETPVGATRWALGLRRASSALSKQAGARRKRALTWPAARASLPQMALDAGALALAYFAAYALRFGGDVPDTYLTLFERTLPFAIVGGVVCLVIVGAYASGAAARPVKVAAGVGLATLALVAFIAFLQPVVVSSSQGFVARNVPLSVCVLFAIGASALMGLSRAAIVLARLAR